jgi:hypothetical protein
MSLAVVLDQLTRALDVCDECERPGILRAIAIVEWQLRGDRFVK